MVNEPTFNPVHVGDTIITGKVVIAAPVPDDTTFTINVALPDGSSVEGTVEADGTFTVDLANEVTPLLFRAFAAKAAAYEPQAGDEITAIVTANNGTSEKTGPEGSTIVLAAVVTPPTFADYVVAPPVLDSVYVGDTTISGMAVLNTPIPDGTTFMAEVTLPNGTVVTAPVAMDGSFSATVTGPALVAGETISAIIQATNGTDVKDSEAGTTTVLAKTDSGTGSGNGTGNGGTTNGGTNSGAKSNGMQVSYSNKGNQGNDKFPQSGEKSHPVLEMFGVLIAGAAALFLVGSKKDKKSTKE